MQCLMLANKQLMLFLLRKKNNMSEFKEKLSFLINTSNINNPYNQDKQIPDNTYHYVKNLVNDYPDTDEMLNAVSNILMQNGQDPTNAAQDFLDICISAINTSGTGLPKEMIQHGRKTKTKTLKDLNKLLKKCSDFRDTLEKEPSPQTIEITLKNKFRFENKTESDPTSPTPVFLNTILRKTENIISQKIKNINCNDNFLSNKPNLNKFIISIYQSISKRKSCELKHKHIVTIALACTSFDEVDENNVKQAIYSSKKLEKK